MNENLCDFIFAIVMLFFIVGFIIYIATHPGDEFP